MTTNRRRTKPKTCRRCLVEQPISAFRNGRTSDGRPKYRLGECRACASSSECICTLCREGKPREDFRNGTSRDGSPRYRFQCRSCRSESHAKWRQANPNYQLEADLAKFGFTIESFNALVAEVDGRCEICQGPPTRARLDIDHCHTKGHVRGLLCSPCNRGLGVFEDDPERLRLAAEYLESRS